MRMFYDNRCEAGRALTTELQTYARDPEVIVLALPRGGVPVAFEIAQALEVPLDLIIVRKLGLPGQEELAMGAIASGGSVVFNQELLDQLELPQQTIDAVLQREQMELARREKSYRGDRPPIDVRGKVVILVDDGLATGSSMRAAVQAIKQQGPKRIIVAVPVAPGETVAVLRSEVDQVICPATPSPFYGVGRWYEDFAQTSDDEVRALLERATRSRQEPSTKEV